VDGINRHWVGGYRRDVRRRRPCAEQPGLNPYFIYDAGWTARCRTDRQASRGRLRPVPNPQAQAALAQFVYFGDPATQRPRSPSWRTHMTTEVPVRAVAHGGPGLGLERNYRVADVQQPVYNPVNRRTSKTPSGAARES
jgi:hypothetical protein